MSEEIKNPEQQPTNSTPEGNGGQGADKLFTQEDVNRIVSERLARERTKGEQSPVDAREQALKARESRMDCREYLSGKGYPAQLLDVLDTSDSEKFTAAVDKLIQAFPNIGKQEVPPPYAAGTGTQPLRFNAIADAFKPRK